jgi:chromosome partitioning protein
MLITLASTKGGSGKTVIAAILVASAASEGHPVVAVDADPTGALSRWASRIYEGLRFPVYHETDDVQLAHLLAGLRERPGLTVCDTAGFGNRAAAVAITSADLVLVPMVPGEADIAETRRTLRLVEGLAAAARRDIPGRVIFNRARPTAVWRHARDELVRAGLPHLKSSLSDLVAFTEQTFSGRPPGGAHGGGRAAAEVAAFLEELRSHDWFPSRTEDGRTA